MGGAIWGDSSVPGRNSRFDLAFRREMKRVLPDKDKDWEELPKNHPILDPRQAYFSEIKDVPPGINFYQEPIYALKIYGEIAVIYTANDYGDMWQIGLTDDGEIDMRRNPHDPGLFVATNNDLLKNLTKESVTTSYKFGTNIVLHLLTRWESKVKNASTAL